MKDLGLNLTAPVSLVIILAGFGLLFGADPWLVAKTAAFVVPLLGYLVFAIFTVIWAIKVGEVGLRQEMTFQAKFYFYHGMAVVLTMVMAAAGSFILLFASLLGGILGGTPR